MATRRTNSNESNPLANFNFGYTATKAFRALDRSLKFPNDSQDEYYFKLSQLNIRKAEIVEVSFGNERRKRLYCELPESNKYFELFNPAQFNLGKVKPDSLVFAFYEDISQKADWNAKSQSERIAHLQAKNRVWLTKCQYI